jgi:hypothetical protein
MFDLQVWQSVVIVVVATVPVGWMSFAIVRMFSRRAAVAGVVREGNAVESALVGGTVPAGARVFDAWSYRVGARFAGRVRIAVYADTVAVAGPRVPRRLYEGWIWVQGLLLALVPPSLAAAIVAADWRWLLAAVALFVVSYAVSMGGAGLWPGLGELGASTDGGFFKALEFPRAAVRDVAIGKGWSRGGLEVVLLPYRAAIDAMAGVRAVSFFAPDEHGHEVRFALHMHSDGDAVELARLLAGGTADGVA